MEQERERECDGEAQKERKKEKTARQGKWCFTLLSGRTASSDLTNGFLTPFLNHLSCKPVCVCVKNNQDSETNCENAALT